MAEAKTKKNEHKGDCGCVSCQLGWTGEDSCGCGCHRNIWHLVAKILLAVIIFWLGVQFGELRILAGTPTGSAAVNMNPPVGQMAPVAIPQPTPDVLVPIPATTTSTYTPDDLPR